MTQVVPSFLPLSHVAFDPVLADAPAGHAEVFLVELQGGLHQQPRILRRCRTELHVQRFCSRGRCLRGVIGDVEHLAPVRQRLDRFGGNQRGDDLFRPKDDAPVPEAFADGAGDTLPVQRLAQQDEQVATAATVQNAEEIVLPIEPEQVDLVGSGQVIEKVDPRHPAVARQLPRFSEVCRVEDAWLEGNVFHWRDCIGREAEAGVEAEAGLMIDFRRAGAGEPEGRSAGAERETESEPGRQMVTEGADAPCSS